MKSLTRVMGETLTLIFSPQGALSSARLNGQTVTPEISYIRESDCEECLDVFGFKSTWSSSEFIQFSQIHERLRNQQLGVFNVMHTGNSYYSVFLCDSRDSLFIHKTTVAVMMFDSHQSKFIRAVRLFDMPAVVCERLITEEWR